MRKRKEIKPNLNLLLQSAIIEYQNDFKEWKELQKRKYDCYSIDSDGEFWVNKYIESLNKRIKESERKIYDDVGRMQRLKQKIKGEKENE